MSKTSSLLVSRLSFGALALGVTALPAPAEACTFARAYIQSTFPRDGAVEVAPDAPVLVYGPGVGSQTPIFRKADGSPVPFEGVGTPNGVRYLPFAGLEPNTTYEFGVRIDDEDRDQITTFSTGELARGPRTPPMPPELEVRLIDTSVQNDMCGPRTGICLRGAAPEGSTLEVWVGNDVIAVPSSGSEPVFRAYAASVLPDECIEVRVRDPYGELSEPTTFCQGELPRLDIASAGGNWNCDSAFAATPTPWHGNAAGPLGAEDPAGAAGDAGDAVLSSGYADQPSPRVVEGGCALRPTATTTTSGASALLLGLAALFMARQRRRTR